MVSIKEFAYKHFIIRSTWVYGLGNNFINDLLEKVIYYGKKTDKKAST